MVEADRSLLKARSRSPPEGQVLLAHKQTPLHEMPLEESGKLPVCCLR